MNKISHWSYLIWLNVNWSLGLTMMNNLEDYILSHSIKRPNLQWAKIRVISVKLLINIGFLCLGLNGTHLDDLDPITSSYSQMCNPLATRSYPSQENLNIIYFHHSPHFNLKNPKTSICTFRSLTRWIFKPNPLYPLLISFAFS